MRRAAAVNRPRSRRLIRSIAIAVAVLAALLATAATSLWLLARPALGEVPSGVRQARIAQSPQWRDGQFRNVLARQDGPLLRAISAFAFGGSDYRSPATPVPVQVRRAADYTTAPASGLRVTWLGHSTLLLEIDGRRVLIDPVWGERASPFSFMGPQRFYAPLLPLAELPAVDAVIISHDHYDHLDVSTVKALAARGVRWVVPLGVGAHLESWGVAAGQITELDWWGNTVVQGLTVTATPARHFPDVALGMPDARCGLDGPFPAPHTGCSTAATRRYTTNSPPLARKSARSTSR